MDFCGPSAGPNFSLRPEGRTFFFPKGKRFRPPVLFSAAQPPRPFWAAPTSVGVRRREPVCGATVVYSIKKGPHCAVRSGGAKRTGRLAVQEKSARGSEGYCPTGRRGRAPWTPNKVCGKSPVQKEGVYGGTWFPRQIARGPRCGAALHFRRNAAIVGVSGHIPASGRTTGILAPTIFLWYRQAAPSLFLKKRWWGRKHPSWRGLEMRPAAAEIGLAASAARVSPSVGFADSSPVRERRDEVHPSP